MSEVKFPVGGYNIPSLSLVTADNDTITGDGTNSSPLTATGAAGGLLNVTADEQVLAGSPVFIEGDDTDAGTAFCENALATPEGNANAIGLAVAANATITDFSTPLEVRTAGPLTLPTATWDVITGDSGGLQAGAVYYVSSATAGHLTRTKPPIATVVGVAMTATTMDVKVSAPNQGPFTIFPVTGSYPATALGEPVRANGSDSYGLAQADSQAHSAVIGVISHLSTGSQGNTAQYAGELTLTTGQWDARTGGSGGLTAGAPYYLDAATAGKITAAPPVGAGTFVVPIGSALTTTTLRLQIGAPVGPHA